MPKTTFAGHPLHPMLIVAPANLALRRKGYKHTGGSLALSAIAAVGVFVSGWFGSRMVYEQGMRVKGVDPVEHAPDVKTLPADERVGHALRAAERHVPQSGPMLH